MGITNRHLIDFGNGLGRVRIEFESRELGAEFV
jgi:hypothetical protein